MLARVLDWVFQAGCAGCDAPVAPGMAMCPGCALSLYEIEAACPRCGEPIEGPVDVTCSRCLRAPLPLERMTAPYRFGGQLAVALRRLKLGKRGKVARALGPLLGPALADAATDCDAIVPVPLHRRRLAARGFNQAQLLARFAARDLPIAVAANALARTRRTPPQRGLGARARATNVAGAFTVPARQRSRVAGARILLVDDVITTGATMSAAARALSATGAAAVVGFAAARADAG